MSSESYTRRNSYGHNSYAASSSRGYPAAHYDTSVSYRHNTRPVTVPDVFRYQVGGFSKPQSPNSMAIASSSNRPDPFQYLETPRSASSRTRQPPHADSSTRPIVFEYEVSDFQSSNPSQFLQREPESQTSVSAQNHSRPGRRPDVFDYQILSSPSTAPRSPRLRIVPPGAGPHNRPRETTRCELEVEVEGWQEMRLRTGNQWDDDPVPPYVPPGEAPPAYEP